jgi:hypothetical protein
MIVFTHDSCLSHSVPTVSNTHPDDVAPASGRITTYHFDTHGIAVERQFEAWGSHTVHTRFTTTETSFDAAVRFWQLGNVMLSENRMPPFDAERDQHLIRLFPGDHLLLTILLEG